MKNRKYPLFLFVIVLILSIASLSGCKKEPSADDIDTGGNGSVTQTPDLPDEGQEDEDVSDNDSDNNNSQDEDSDSDITEDKTDETPSVVYDTNSPLKDVFSDYFLMGAAINGYSVETAAINHEGMSNILKTHFNSTTLSNLMKPSYLLDHEASKASPDGMPACTFTSIDSSMKFCQENGIKMRGHTLIWHTQTPDWFFYEDYDTSKNLVDAATMDLRIESYIKQVLEYCQQTYPDVIYCWDVVNEAINDNGTWRATDSLYYQIMQETYIEKAFYYARKYAAEGVSLFYNEYNVFNPNKRLAMFTMLSSLKEKGLVDGVGLQPTVGLNHPELDSDNSASSFKKTLEVFGQLGLEIQVTELGFLIDGENAVTPENIQKQADRYYEMMYLLVRMDSDNGGPCNITSVTTFGICDDYPLYNNHKQNIYLWDKQANPKPAFYSYLQAGLDFQAANR